MDPAIPPRPKQWRTLGRIGRFLLVAAVATAAGGCLASTRGQDPSVAYRLAVMFRGRLEPGDPDFLAAFEAEYDPAP
jgi:hypothetical protein